MLNHHLHGPIFKGNPYPPPDPRAIVISKEHLRMHGLDPKKASTVPDTSFDLPLLQGDTIDEHFHRIGTAAAQPWLQLSKELAASNFPALPKLWNLTSGWTKYHFDEN